MEFIRINSGFYYKASFCSVIIVYTNYNYRIQIITVTVIAQVLAK